MPRINFQNDAVAEETDLTLSLLEIALKHDIPRMHICGGNARCSTCRIIIEQGLENMMPYRAKNQEHRAF